MRSIMKKLQMIAVLILTLLFVSACVPDEDDDEGFLNNDQTDTVSGGDSGIDSDTTNDTLPDDQQDTDSDTSDTTSDNADTANDPVDPTDPTADPTDPTDPTEPTTDPTEPTTDPTEPTTDPTDPTTDPTGPSSELPECSDADITPCKDSSSGHIWSKKFSNVTLSSADSNCQGLKEGGLNGWRLPTIGELRTLIQNCSSTQTSSTSCLVSDDCLANTDECTAGCSSCASDSSGKYSKLGDTGMLWSSSNLEGNFYYVWTINFHSANFSYASNVSDKYAARCIKK